MPNSIDTKRNTQQDKVSLILEMQKLFNMHKHKCNTIPKYKDRNYMIISIGAVQGIDQVQPSFTIKALKNRKSRNTFKINCLGFLLM